MSQTGFLTFPRAHCASQLANDGVETRAKCFLSLSDFRVACLRFGECVLVSKCLHHQQEVECASSPANATIVTVYICTAWPLAPAFGSSLALDDSNSTGSADRDLFVDTRVELPAYAISDLLPVISMSPADCNDGVSVHRFRSAARQRVTATRVSLRLASTFLSVNAQAPDSAEVCLVTLDSKPTKKFSHPFSRSVEAAALLPIRISWLLNPPLGLYR